MEKFIQIKSYNDCFFRNKIVSKLNSYAGVITQTQYYELVNLVRSYCSNVFKNLNEFPYVYFTAGISQAIDYLISQEPTFFNKDDYRYLLTLPNAQFSCPMDRMYLSYPFSSTGRFQEIPLDRRLILDCAYIFASNLRCVSILPPNVEQVLFSVSKSHNLADLRIGWFFSRNIIPCYEILQHKYNYINVLHLLGLESIIDYPVNFLYCQNQTLLSDLYKKNNLEETDTNLFALDGKKRVPYYIL